MNISYEFRFLSVFFNKTKLKSVLLQLLPSMNKITNSFTGQFKYASKKSTHLQVNFNMAAKKVT